MANVERRVKENSMRHAVPKTDENERQVPRDSFQRFQNRQNSPWLCWRSTVQDDKKALITIAMIYAWNVGMPDEPFTQPQVMIRSFLDLIKICVNFPIPCGYAKGQGVSDNQEWRWHAFVDNATVPLWFVALGMCWVTSLK